MIPSLHPDLLRGVASYWLEFFRAAPDLDTVLAPIGQGSGICAAIAAREALGLRTRIIGVVSAHADAYARSFESRCVQIAPALTRIADGMACSVPDPEAMELIWRHVDDIVRVDDAAVVEAMRLLYTATHNLAEGAGAAALAGALALRDRLRGRRVGIVLSGGNVDLEQFVEIMREAPPARACALAAA
jgi:threonine dehydratase